MNQRYKQNVIHGSR